MTATELAAAGTPSASGARLSVIVETSTDEEYRRRRDSIHEAASMVKRLLGQESTVPVEFLIMAEREAAESWRPLTHHPYVRLVPVDHANYYAMKNAGAAAATTEYVAFLDGDCTPQPGWAATAIAALDAGADVVAGRTRYVDRGPCGRTMSYFDMGNVSTGPDGSATAFQLNNVAFRRAQYLDRPLDSRLRRSGGCYLLHLQLRAAGRRIVYEPKMFVEHENDFKDSLWLAKRIRNGHDAATIYRVDDTAVVPYRWLQRLGPLGAPLIVGRRIWEDIFRLRRTHEDFDISAAAAPLVWLVGVPLRVVEGMAYAISSVQPAIIGRRWG